MPRRPRSGGLGELRPGRRDRDRFRAPGKLRGRGKEHIETALRVEPGVLVLYAVSEKDDPTNVRVFEVYASMDAYKAHLEAPHFKKYKTTTEKMVSRFGWSKQLRLRSGRSLGETVPLCSAGGGLGHSSPVRPPLT